MDGRSFFVEMLVSEEVFYWIESCWGASGFAYNDPIWEILIEQAFQEKIASGDINYVRPFCMRLVGQSGSGKTSQLLPATQAALCANHVPYVSFAVRDFVKFHPKLEFIVKRYGESLLREKANAFALILLTNVLLRCISKKIPILLEVTLLAPVYEARIHAALIANGYRCDYQCLAIPKKVSDDWIQKRFLETKRVVSQNSSSFFYDTLAPAFKFLQGISLKNRVFIWDRVHEQPLILDFQEPNVYDKIEAARALEGPFFSPEVSVAAKTKFLCDFYKKHSID